MIKVLAIGNSFSQDATRYLKQIADCAGEPMTVVNLYIGGCSLATHYKNMNNDDKRYSLEFNGEATGFYVSIREALQSREWDYVTMQQASPFSFNYATYQPYLNALSEYVCFHAPHAIQVMHQTWAYEDGSKILTEDVKYETSEQMFADVREAYACAADEIGAAIIPSGEAMQLAVEQGYKMHRDTFHASLGIGRYLLGATWFETLTGKSILGNSFDRLDIAVDKNELEKMQEIAHSVSMSYR